MSAGNLESPEKPKCIMVVMDSLFFYCYKSDYKGEVQGGMVLSVTSLFEPVKK